MPSEVMSRSFGSGRVLGTILAGCLLLLATSQAIASTVTIKVVGTLTSPAIDSNGYFSGVKGADLGGDTVTLTYDFDPTTNEGSGGCRLTYNGGLLILECSSSVLSSGSGTVTILGVSADLGVASVDGRTLFWDEGYAPYLSIVIGTSGGPLGTVTTSISTAEWPATTSPISMSPNFDWRSSFSANATLTHLPGKHC